MKTLSSEVRFVHGGAGDDIVGGVSHEEFIEICRSQYQMNPFETAVDKVLGVAIAGMALAAFVVALDTCSSLYNWYSDNFAYNEENGHYCCLS
jgi:orotate phosphoribosyltransferase-like protein